MGERIAGRTEPGAKRGRELTVNVASASWAQELSLLMNEIVVRIRAAGFGVDTIRFRVKEIAPPARDPAALKPTHRKAELPNALTQKLDGIEDSELRDAIGEAAALWLALDEAPSKPRPLARPGPARASAPPAAPTSTRPNARSPRDAESRSARSDRTPSPGRAKPPGKP